MPLFLLVALKETDGAVETAVGATVAPERVYKVEQGVWVIDSEAITAKDVSDQLGLTVSTTHIVVGFRGYYGRAQPDLWEWIAAKSGKG